MAVLRVRDCGTGSLFVLVIEVSLVLIQFTDVSAVEAGASSHECSAEAMQTCDSIFNFRSGISSFPLAISSTGSIESICQQYDAYHTCVSEFLDTCQPRDQLKYKAIHATVTYVCDERLHDFESQHLCYNKFGVAQGISECSNSYQHQKQDVFAQVARGVISNTQSYAELCRIRQNFLICAETYVRTYDCGRDAETLIYGYFYRVTIGDFDTIQAACPHYSTLPPRTSRIITIYKAARSTVPLYTSKYHTAVIKTTPHQPFKPAESGKFSTPAQSVNAVPAELTGSTHSHQLGNIIGAIGAVIGFVIVLILIFIVYKLNVLAKLRARFTPPPSVAESISGPPISTIMPDTAGQYGNPVYSVHENSIHIMPGATSGGGSRGSHAGHERNSSGASPPDGLYLYESLNYPRSAAEAEVCASPQDNAIV